MLLCASEQALSLFNPASRKPFSLTSILLQLRNQLRCLPLPLLERTRALCPQDLPQPGCMIKKEFHSSQRPVHSFHSLVIPTVLVLSSQPVSLKLQQLSPLPLLSARTQPSPPVSRHTHYQPPISKHCGMLLLTAPLYGGASPPVHPLAAGPVSSIHHPSAPPHCPPPCVMMELDLASRSIFSTRGRSGGGMATRR